MPSQKQLEDSTGQKSVTSPGTCDTARSKQSFRGGMFDSWCKQFSCGPVSISVTQHLTPDVDSPGEFSHQRVHSFLRLLRLLMGRTSAHLVMLVCSQHHNKLTSSLLNLRVEEVSSKLTRSLQSEAAYKCDFVPVCHQSDDPGWTGVRPCVNRVESLYHCL